MRTDRLRAAYEIELRYTLFPLHPDTPAEGLTLQQLFAGRSFDIEAAQARLADLMAEEGLLYGRRTMTYNSRLAQELAKWAETQDGGTAIHDALYRAYFVDVWNIARIDNLLSVVRQIELPEDEARQALVSRRFRAAVDADWQRCRDFGITAVPTFVVGNQGVTGAQSYEVLEALVVNGNLESFPGIHRPPTSTIRSTPAAWRWVTARRNWPLPSAICG